MTFSFLLLPYSVPSTTHPPYVLRRYSVLRLHTIMAPTQRPNTVTMYGYIGKIPLYKIAITIDFAITKGIPSTYWQLQTSASQPIPLFYTRHYPSPTATHCLHLLPSLTTHYSTLLQHIPTHQHHPQIPPPPFPPQSS